MAWQDDIINPLVIITGDNKSYTVGWRPDGIVEEYNIAEFEFNNVAGSLVKKALPKGRKYPFKFFFQGDDHINVLLTFLDSAKDTRPCNVQHPLYGNILCHFAGLSIDHSGLNISEITCTLLETITDETPSFTSSPVDKISSDKDANDAALLSAFDEKPNASDIATLQGTNKQLYTKGNRLQSTESYFNLFTDANAGVTNATAQPLAAMRKTQALINAPASFESSVQSRIGALTNQFNSLRSTVAGITGRSGKKIYELQGATLISSMCLAAATPLVGDYNSKNSVLGIITPLVGNYNNYINDLDSLQTENGGQPTSYIPDPDSISGLNSLLNFTVSQLFNIALSAKQQRTILLEDDSNWINLAHRFYGISPDNNEVELLMNQNEAGLSEALQVQKGRRIVYYV